MIKIVKRFTGLEKIGNIYELIFATADLVQLLFGFIVAVGGLAWNRGLPDESLPESAVASKRLVVQQVWPLQRYFQNPFALHRMVPDIGWNHYLRFGEYTARQSTTGFWEWQRPDVIPGANGLPAVPYLPVAEIELIVARLPCHEDGVEKAFSRLGLVFGDHRRSIHDNLIEALFVVRLHDIPNVPRSSQVLDSVGRDLSTWSNSDPPYDERGCGPPSPQGGGTDAPASNPNQDEPTGGKAPWS
jgi:hypothetical protein